MFGLDRRCRGAFLYVRTGGWGSQSGQLGRFRGELGRLGFSRKVGLRLGSRCDGSGWKRGPSFPSGVRWRTKLNRLSGSRCGYLGKYGVCSNRRCSLCTGCIRPHACRFWVVFGGGYRGVREKGRRLCCSRCDGLGRWGRPRNSRLPFSRSAFGLRWPAPGCAGDEGTKGTAM